MQLKVTPDELEAVGSQLSTASQEVSRQLESTKSQVQNLVDRDWEGAASNGLRELFGKWQTGASQVKEALDGISGMLGQAAKAYRDAEEQLASHFRG